MLQPSGTKGLDYGGKTTLLDTIKILQPLWGGNNKYTYSDSIARCWRNADILPVSWNADINNNIGSQLLSNNNKQISLVQCNKLCFLFEQIQVKVSADDSGDTVMLSTFSNSLAYETAINSSDLQVMTLAWNTVEDDPDVIDAEKLMMNYYQLENCM